MAWHGFFCAPYADRLAGARPSPLLPLPMLAIIGSNGLETLPIRQARPRSSTGLPPPHVPSLSPLRPVPNNVGRASPPTLLAPSSGHPPSTNPQALLRRHSPLPRTVQRPRPDRQQPFRLHAAGARLAFFAAFRRALCPLGKRLISAYCAGRRHPPLWSWASPRDREPPHTPAGAASFPFRSSGPFLIRQHRPPLLTDALRAAGLGGVDHLADRVACVPAARGRRSRPLGLRTTRRPALPGAPAYRETLSVCLQRQKSGSFPSSFYAHSATH